MFRRAISTACLGLALALVLALAAAAPAWAGPIAATDRPAPTPLLERIQAQVQALATQVADFFGLDFLVAADGEEPDSALPPPETNARAVVDESG